MIAIFGTRSFGYVDRIPGIGYVATQFFHVNFVPLFPVKTFFILEGTESDNGFRGQQLSMSGKSVLAGYLRMWGVYGAVLAAGMSWFLLGGMGSGEGFIGFALAVAAVGLVVAAAAVWNKLWIVAQGLFHLGSVIGLVVAAMAGKLNGVIETSTAVANGLMLVYALTRLMDVAGHSRAVQLLEALGYDRETAEEIIDERNPRRQTASRDDDD